MMRWNMIYYNFNYIIYLLLAIYIYMIVFNVYILFAVKSFRNNKYYKSINIPSVYANLLLASNYTVFWWA